jgi:hypothetical protein
MEAVEAELPIRTLEDRGVVVFEIEGAADRELESAVVGYGAPKNVNPTLGDPGFEVELAFAFRRPRPPPCVVLTLGAGFVTAGVSSASRASRSYGTGATESGMSRNCAIRCGRSGMLSPLRATVPGTLQIRAGLNVV